MSEVSSHWTRLAAELKRVRKERGLTQKELAHRMGRPIPRVSELESGLGDPRMSSVVRLANALGMALVAVPAAKAGAFTRDPLFSYKQVDPPTVFEELFVPDEDPDE